jgi:hypothetical protein
VIEISPFCASASVPLWIDVEQFFTYWNFEMDFTLDAFYGGRASDRPRSFSLEAEGLSRSWKGERVFVALPPGESVEPWLQKALIESTTNGALVVCMTVASPEADWWQWWSCNASEIRFPRGRIKFESSDEAPAWPVAIFIFRPTSKSIPKPAESPSPQLNET